MVVANERSAKISKGPGSSTALATGNPARSDLPHARLRFHLDNTVIAMVLGDNGASAEVGPKGSINELRGSSGQPQPGDIDTAILLIRGMPLMGSYSLSFGVSLPTLLPDCRKLASSSIFPPKQ
jgi:hypothetical protein